MLVKAKIAVKHNGTRYLPGSIFDVSDEDGNRLIRVKAAENVDSEDEKPVLDKIPTPNKEADLIDVLIKVEGINEDLAKRLIEAGYHTLEDIANADAEDLQVIKGIGPKNCETIQDSADELLEAESEDEDE